MAKLPLPSSAQVNGTAPVPRYPETATLSTVTRRAVARDLLAEGMKPRHIRKALGMTARQLRKAKRGS